MGVVNLKKELLIVFICVLAASIGPSILIGAKYMIGFTIFSLITALASIVLYYLLCSINSVLINKTNKPLYYMVSNLLGIVPLILFFLYWFELKQMLLQISSEIGLANFNVIIILALCILIYHIWKMNKSTLEVLIKINILYFLPIMIAFMTSYTIFSSEGRILMVNVVIVYFFLKSIIE